MESMKANFEHWSMIIPTPRQNRELGPAWREEGQAGKRENSIENTEKV